jgi:hypothetical protein
LNQNSEIFLKNVDGEIIVVLELKQFENWKRSDTTNSNLTEQIA